MKVLLVNGSYHEKGCTYTALCEVAKALETNGVETEIYWIGNQAIGGCRGCAACRKLGKCAFDEGGVNEFLAKVDEFDGFVFGTPVHYASAAGAMASFMDRVFYSSVKKFLYKPAAAVVSCRRGGASTTFDVMNKYFTISNMMVVGSNYWNEVHGNTPEEVMQDEEGLEVAARLGRNMAWLVKAVAAAKDDAPAYAPRPMYNYIR